MTDLDRLWQLQAVDAELQRLRDQLERHPARVELQQALSRREQLHQQLQQLEARLGQRRRKVREGELEVRSSEQELRGLEERLFGGAVTHPKELSGLQGRAEAVRRRWQQLQEQVLEEMVQLEQDEADRDRLHQEAADLDQAVQRGQRRWDQVQAELEASLEQLSARRQQLVTSMEDPVWLQRYQRLYEAKAGRPVAEVVEGRCGGCGAPVPTMLLEALRRPQRPVVCEVCGRILYRPTPVA